jgi:hypothetical protein
MSDYKMVPVVATDWMLSEAQRTRMDHSDFDDWMEFEGRSFAKVYRSMLAAAPKELPEEVVQGMVNAMLVERIKIGDGHEYSPEQYFERLTRAALEAVMGVGDG